MNLRRFPTEPTP